MPERSHNNVRQRITKKGCQADQEEVSRVAKDRRSNADTASTKGMSSSGMEQSVNL